MWDHRGAISMRTNSQCLTNWLVTDEFVSSIIDCHWYHHYHLSWKEFVDGMMVGDFLIIPHTPPVSKRIFANTPTELSHPSIRRDVGFQCTHVIESATCTTKHVTSPFVVKSSGLLWYTSHEQRPLPPVVLLFYLMILVAEDCRHRLPYRQIEIQYGKTPETHHTTSRWWFYICWVPTSLARKVTSTDHRLRGRGRSKKFQAEERTKCDSGIWRNLHNWRCTWKNKNNEIFLPDRFIRNIKKSCLFLS